MVEITIQVPDELAQRIEPFQNRLPELLWQLLEMPSLSRSIEADVSEDFSDRTAVYQEIIDFLSNCPTPEEIVEFKVSDREATPKEYRTQARLRTLLDKNRESMLDALELAELDVFEQLDHLMILLKASAYSRLESAP